MTWKAPDVERPEGPLTGPERPLLQAFLDWQRATLLYKCAGLTGEQLARRTVPPSSLSLLGLVRHMTRVERAWFRMRFAVALKSSVRRAGRWRVPERYTTVVYKGGGWLDLRAAELSGPVTTFVAVAYKSRVTILVPPSVRVEMTGFGVTQGAEEDPGYQLPADAPVIHVRGVAYKGTVEIATRPPERPALRQ